MSFDSVSVTTKTPVRSRMLRKSFRKLLNDNTVTIAAKSSFKLTKFIDTVESEGGRKENPLVEVDIPFQKLSLNPNDQEHVDDESNEALNPSDRPIDHNDEEYDPLDDDLLAALASIHLDGVNDSAFGSDDLFFPDALDDIDFDIEFELDEDQGDVLLDFQGVFDEPTRIENEEDIIESLIAAFNNRTAGIDDHAFEADIFDHLQYIDTKHVSAQDFPQEWLCHPCIDPEEPIFPFQTFLENGDYFPSHWLCQPCQPSKGPNTFSPLTAGQLGLSTRQKNKLVSISEEATLKDGALVTPLAPPQNMDRLLPFTFTKEEEDAMEDTNLEAAQSLHQYVVSSRVDAVAAAFIFTRSFGTDIYQTPLEIKPVTARQERSCLGHKETIFGLHFSDCGQFMATASQDATIRIWRSDNHTLLSTLMGHDKTSECLRVAWAPQKWCNLDSQYQYVLASGGANGVVKMWATHDITGDSWKCIGSIDHTVLLRDPNQPTPSEQDKNEPGDPPQVYALQFIDNWQGLARDGQSKKNSFLMTSSDDFIHLWEIRNDPTIDSMEFSLTEVMSFRFTCLEHFGFGVSVARVTSGGLPIHPTDENSNELTGTTPRSFGGERNPNNIIFVFDASYCDANGLLGVALSDGSLRLVNGRGVCVSILQLPGCQSHLTSFCWDKTGLRLASCVATGHLILWSLSMSDGRGRVIPSCTAVLEGGHEVGRPLFGAQYCGITEEDLIISWGVDGRLCLWDSHSKGNIHAPISTLISKSDYPIYAVDISTSDTRDTEILSRIGVGGGNDGGFLGIPAFMYDVIQDKKRTALAEEKLSCEETNNVPSFSESSSSTMQGNALA